MGGMHGAAAYRACGVSVKEEGLTNGCLLGGGQAMLQAGLIVAGWDARDGGSVFGVPLGGTLVKLPFTLGAAPSLQHIACVMLRMLHVLDDFDINEGVRKCVRDSRRLGLGLHLRLLRQELEARHERGRLPCICGEGCVARDGARWQLGRCAAAAVACWVVPGRRLKLENMELGCLGVSCFIGTLSQDACPLCKCACMRTSSGGAPGRQCLRAP